MRRRTRRRSFIGPLIWMALAVILVLFYLNQHPIRLSTSMPVQHGTGFMPERSTDVLVVIWSNEVMRSAESGNFDSVDWSWVWADILAAEVGPVQVIEAEELDEEAIDHARFIVLTHSAAVHPEVMDDTHLLERFVNHGGVLLLERPEGQLRTAFSADGRGGMRTPTAITDVWGLPQDLAQALKEMPLFTRFVGSTGPLEGAENLLAMDGAPVVYRIPRADGAALTVDFNLPLALLSLRQGRPSTPEFGIEPGEPGRSPGVQDLVSHPSMLEATVPYADLLTHFIVQVALAGASGLPGLWFYPDEASGAVVLTHTVTDDGDQAAWLSRYEAGVGASSTFFFSNRGIPRDAIAAGFERGLAEPALLWERGSAPHYHNRVTLGVGWLRPFYREIGLDAQRQRLAETWPWAQGNWGVRLRDGVWTGKWAQPFQAMAAAGIRYDSSYGPHGQESVAGPAYWHGTGRPFAVYDANGLPLHLAEIPIVANGIAGAEDVENLDRLIDQSQRRFHQAIAVDIDSDFLARAGALATFDNWQHLIEKAGQARHIVMSASQLVEFGEMRASSGLRSQLLRRQGDRDAASVETVLAIEIEVPTDHLRVRVPRQIGDRRLRDVVATSREPAATTSAQMPSTRNEDVFGQEVTLIEVSPAIQRLEVTYR